MKYVTRAAPRSKNHRVEGIAPLTHSKMFDGCLHGCVNRVADLFDDIRRYHLAPSKVGDCQLDLFLLLLQKNPVGIGDDLLGFVFIELGLESSGESHYDIPRRAGNALASASQLDEPLDLGLSLLLKCAYCAVDACQLAGDGFHFIRVFHVFHL